MKQLCLHVAPVKGSSPCELKRNSKKLKTYKVTKWLPQIKNHRSPSLFSITLSLPLSLPLSSVLCSLSLSHPHLISVINTLNPPNNPMGYTPAFYTWGNWGKKEQKLWNPSRSPLSREPRVFSSLKSCGSTLPTCALSNLPRSPLYRDLANSYLSSSRHSHNLPHFFFSACFPSKALLAWRVHGSLATLASWPPRRQASSGWYQRRWKERKTTVDAASEPGPHGPEAPSAWLCRQKGEVYIDTL